MCLVLTIKHRALESIEAGKRLSEARFAMEIMPKGQRSVLSFTGI